MIATKKWAPKGNNDPMYVSALKGNQANRKGKKGDYTGEKGESKGEKGDGQNGDLKG